MVQLLPNHFETLISLINQLSSNSHAITVSILVKTNQMEDSKLSAQQPCMHLVSVLLYRQHITMEEKSIVKVSYFNYKVLQLIIFF